MPRKPIRLVEFPPLMSDFAALVPSLLTPRAPASATPKKG
jgi:hypothetical protein